MAWYNETITTMGIISKEVYDDGGRNYFIDEFNVDGTKKIKTIEGTTYKVIAHTDTTTDMQALLLESGGQYVIAFRGTASWVDVLVDGVIGLDNINAQYDDAVAFVQQALDRPEIDENNLILTGHSLGGILTQQVGATFHLEGYAFNPYGVDRLLSMMPNSPLDPLLEVAIYNIMSSVGLGSTEATWAKDHILNISYNDFGFLNGDILSNFATELTSGHLGAYLPIYGADIWLDGHSIIVLNEAIKHYNEVLEHFSDKDFVNLSLAYISTKSYEKTETIFNDLGVYHASGLSFNFLIDDSASDISSQAKGDNTVLYALLHMNPFAIVGNLPAYTNLNPKDYSDQFFEDRAQYLYYSIDPIGRYYDLDTGDMTTHYGGDGPELFVPLVSDKDILFGGIEDNTIISGNGDDRLYGMDGHDTLFASDGNDYLEGGSDGDMMLGGTGFDTYIANNEDSIFDADGNGRVIFEDVRLTGGKSKELYDPTYKNDDGVYNGNGGTYILKNGILRFTDSNGTLTINNFKNGDLGIKLVKEQPEDPENSTPERPYQHGSPLVLDFNGDGVTSTFIYSTKTYFDLDNDGFKERTGWMQNSDGLLVLDKNSDGVINNGNELFGNYTKDTSGNYSNNGFDALAKYDDNHDGMINSSDNVYKALKVWQDVDSDGITDEGELKTLGELGISSINLSYVTANALEERNSIRETSTFTTQSTDADGNITTQVNVINDVWFDRDVKDTKSTTDYTQISDEIKSLGNVNGSGDVEDLAVAMSKDSVLVTKVEALIDAIQNGESLNSLETLTKDIIVRWSGTENTTGINDWMSAAFSYIKVTNQDVAIVERFNGEGFYTNVNGVMKRGVLGAEAHFYIRDMNEYIIDKTLMSILAHTVFGDSIADENGYMVLSELKSAIQQALSQDAIDAYTLDAITNIAQIYNEMLGENASMDFIEELGFSKDRYYDQYTLLEKSYTKNHGGDADNEMFDNNSVALSGNGYGENSILYGQDGSDKLYGGDGHDELYGGAGDDYIDGGWGMDLINGGDGNDIICDGNGQANDIIIGGKGNDTINMTGYGFQADTLVYRYGDGNDMIIDERGTAYNDNSRYYGNNNQIILQNIRFEDIQIIYAGRDMIINVMDVVSNTVNGTIRIKNGYVDSPINSFVFDDQVLSFYEMQLIAGKLIQDDIYSFNQGEGTKIL